MGYIEPVIKIHNTFEEAKKDYDIGTPSFLGDGDGVGISDILRGRSRNVVVGEPGVGKTELLKELEKRLVAEGKATKLVHLGQSGAISEAEDFLTEEGVGKVILFDALDEVSSDKFQETLRAIERIGSSNGDLTLYVSCRWVFINKHATSFSGYRFLTVAPFTLIRVRKYLVDEKGIDGSEADKIIIYFTSLGRPQTVIQIPRYLCLLAKFVSDKNAYSVGDISIGELFDYFIYSGLSVEDQKVGTDKAAIIKRVLEKLALTMEIYQTNSIRQDELMTFFDEANSDLKDASLNQVPIETFYEKSLLRRIGDLVSFDNTEFQEYLAAKEISRFQDPRRALFEFAVEPTIKEVYPSWFNAMSFLVELCPEVLDSLIDYSGVRNGSKVIDEGFSVLLSRINPLKLTLNQRKPYFDEFLGYYNRVLQWLPGRVAVVIGGCYEPSHESNLKLGVENAGAASGSHIVIGNLLLLVGHLLKAGKLVDRAYWRKKMIDYTADTNHVVVRRHAYFALTQLGDASVLDDIMPAHTDCDETVAREFIEMCAVLSPDSPKTIGYVIGATKAGNWFARYGLLQIKTVESIRMLLRSLLDDDAFRNEFFDHASTFSDRDEDLANRIANLDNKEIDSLAEEVIIKCLVDSRLDRGDVGRSFAAGLWRTLVVRDGGLVERIVTGIVGSGGHFWFSLDFFAKVLDKSALLRLVGAMKIANHRWEAFRIMESVREYRGTEGFAIFESAQALLPEEYLNWENCHVSREAEHVKQQEECDNNLLAEFHKMLNPAPNMFINGVFGFFADHAEALKSSASKDDIDRLRDLLSGSVLQYDLLKVKLTYTSENGDERTYTTSQSVAVFSDALRAASLLGMDIRPFRKNIIRFIPFAYDRDIEMVFKLLNEITPEEAKPLVEVYGSRQNDDLWRHMPINFVNVAERYHLTSVVAVLRALATDKTFDVYVRGRALAVAESMDPDPEFLRRVFSDNVGGQSHDDLRVAEAANASLINTHHDRDSVLWRMDKVKSRVAEFTQARGAHSVSPLENEIVMNGDFAKPLKNFSHRGYEDEYLDLLDTSINIWGRGEQYHAYCQYLWGIVRSYFDNLKAHGDYAPLKRLENKVLEMGDKDGINWFKGIVSEIRRSYLAALGRPRNMSTSVRIMNEVRQRQWNKISNADDLKQAICEAIDTDLKRWVSGGAYKLIVGEKVVKAKAQPYESFIQKTIGDHIENILLKKGISVSLTREAQLLDDKRTDFLVWHGFIGPVVLELKLSSNSDIGRKNFAHSESCMNMRKYMDGYGASQGIFLVIENKRKCKANVKHDIEEIKGVTYKSLGMPTPKVVRGKGAPKRGKRKVAATSSAKSSKIRAPSVKIKKANRKITKYGGGQTPSGTRTSKRR